MGQPGIKGGTESMINEIAIWMIALIIWIIIVAVFLCAWIRLRKSRTAGKPILRQTAWTSVFLQFFIMGVLAAGFMLFVKPYWLSFCLGVTAYLVIHFILEGCIPHNHRKGLLLCKQGNYGQAIEEFKKSYHFFCRHPWIDQYRYLALLSSSKVSYTEMALMNIVFCYAQLNDAALAKAYCQKTLEYFPDSQTAKSTLNMIASLEDKSDSF